MAAEISPLQARFVHEYIKCWNATDAARAAGYKCSTDKAFSVQGARLLANVRIQNAIRKAQEEREKATMYDGAWTITQIAEIAQSREEATRDRLKALELLGKYHGLWDRREDAEAQGVRVVIDTEAGSWAE